MLLTEARPAILDEAMGTLIANELTALPAIRSEKRPAVGRWKEYRTRKPTPAELDDWASGDHDAVCVLTGKPSGNLELLDFDNGGEKFGEWADKIPLELFNRLVVETSQSGGMHAVYRCDSPVCGSKKLATRTGDDGRSVTLIETRGEGGLFLCDPSPGYELQQGDWSTVPTITRAERNLLLHAAWSFDEKAPASKPRPKPTQPADPASGRPGDDYNQRGDVRELLEKHGWTSSGTRADGNEHWSRPGKRFGTSATLKDGGVLCL